MATTLLPAQTNSSAAWLRSVLLSRPLLVQSLVIASLLLSLLPWINHGSAVQAADYSGSNIAHSSSAIAQAASSEESQAVLPENGTYKFGQVPTSDQIGAGYMVFEAVQASVIGVLYSPSSSFDCFRGELQGRSLSMTITNSYTQESYPYAVALRGGEEFTAGNAAQANDTELDGFHQISALDSNDLRMLEVCKTAL